MVSAGTVMALGVGMYYWYTRRPVKHVGQRVRGPLLCFPLCRASSHLGICSVCTHVGARTLHGSAVYN